MNMRYLAIAVAIFILVAALAAVLNSSTVAYAMVEKVYDLANGDAVVFHRNGFTGGYGYLKTVSNVGLTGNFTVCARLLTGYGYSSVQPVIDNGYPYGANWWIEAVPVAGLKVFNYRFSLATSNGVVSIEVPGELYRPHMYCFSVETYSDGTGAIYAYVDGNLSKSVSFSGSRIVQSLPIVVGAYIDGTRGRNTTFTLLLVFNRSLTVTTMTVGNMTVTKSEYVDIANGVIPSDGLVLYFDPTVVDWINNVWVDLSGSGNDMVLSGFMLAFYDNTTFYVIKARYRSFDAVHFQYFPWYSRIEIYDLLGTFYQKIEIRGADNGFGQVIDYRVSLDSRKYRLVYYDPNENITVTTTVPVTETVTTTAVSNVTVTSTAVVPVVSYRTVTTATTVTVAGAAFKWDWLVILAMLVVTVAAIWYLLHKKN